MAADVSRRGFVVGGGLALLAGRAAAQARPQARPLPSAPTIPQGVRPRARVGLAEEIRAAGLEGRASVALVDLSTGSLIEAEDASRPMPPASVAKALTTLWALDAWPLDQTFSTRLLATGPVEGGVVQGDLILAGGGDPALDTDRLTRLAADLKAKGVTGAKGFRVWAGPLPEIREIDPGQLPHLGYNPGISGLNLNFNRVHFEWARRGATYRTRLDARGEETEARPEVAIARMTVEDRDLPVYTYAADGDVDVWTVAKGQLGDAGSRWLPVRNPALYAGQAFAGLLPDLDLPPPTRIEALPEGATELASLSSDTLEKLLKEMLLYSTNLTAEVLGRQASLSKGFSTTSEAESARIMGDWLRRTTGARVHVVDHSGLGPASRVAPLDMALALASQGTARRLRPLLKAIHLTDEAGEDLPVPPALVRAKTGTLNFVSTLAGYARTLGGRDLAFAIFTADLPARERIAADEDEIPEGSRDFLARARRLQQVLLQRWGRTL